MLMRECMSEALQRSAAACTRWVIWLQKQTFCCGMAHPPVTLAGKQQTLVSWLSTRSAATASISQLSSEQDTAAAEAHHRHASTHVNAEPAEAPSSQPSQSTHKPADVFRELPSQPQSHAGSHTAGKRSGSGVFRGGSKRAKPAQSSMRSFFASSVPSAQVAGPFGCRAASAASASQSKSRSGSPVVQLSSEPCAAEPGPEQRAQQDEGSCQQGDQASAQAQGTKSVADGAASRESSGTLTEARSNAQVGALPADVRSCRQHV